MTSEIWLTDPGATWLDTESERLCPNFVAVAWEGIAGVLVLRLWYRNNETGELFCRPFHLGRIGGSAAQDRGTGGKTGCHSRFRDAGM
jgi:hypothetical protein